MLYREPFQKPENLAQVLLLFTFGDKFDRNGGLTSSLSDLASMLYPISHSLLFIMLVATDLKYVDVFVL